ncbi:coiled-coil domain-containing protein 12-like [Saccoglossus kowalevskii]|uniref:Coiled-coil domain-containing protein 12-like n=1 Tax=Saccoglossus kowalevskii TaxID=10224 RepID=A0ABM0GZ84_SACKO|nr:PREDICTED: coiled-coil domain-containing protein 12-like [Saccoglossus kowalevskii]
MAGVGSLQEEALKRKERLKALRRKHQGEIEETGDSEPPEKKIAGEAEEGNKEIRQPIFKNYKPENESLQDAVAERAQPEKVEEHIKDQLEAAKPEPVVEEVDLMNLAPRKPDWDLKRDVSKKLEKLERRTQRAIAELIRERLASGKEDLVTVVNVSAAANQQSLDSDED